MQIGGTTIHSTSKHDSTVPVSSQGSYAGDGSQNRAIPHGLGFAPKLVVIIHSDTARMYGNIAGGVARCMNYQGEEAYTPTAADATNFYVGNAVVFRLNEAAVGAYKWVAIS